MALLLAVVRGRCGKESSRSLSHLLMSFLYILTCEHVFLMSTVASPYTERAALYIGILVTIQLFILLHYDAINVLVTCMDR